MKLMVIGHAKHGKDTVGEMLRDGYGLRFSSSSMFCAERVMMPAFAAAGMPYGSVQECFDDRGNFRMFWHEKIAAYCRLDLARLGREIFAVNDVYCGCRSDREFHALKCEGVFDFALWVDRSFEQPPEPRSSMKLEPWMADYVLDNNGDLESLAKRLRILIWRLDAKIGA